MCCSCQKGRGDTFMGRKTDLKKELQSFKKEISKRMPIECMLFFGSRAKGTAKKYSDVDLLIVSKKFQRKKFHRRSVELYDYWKLDYPVDFLCYTPEEFNKKKKMITIVRQAVKEGI